MKSTVLCWLLIGLGLTVNVSANELSDYRFQLPPGFEISRVAAPPLVERPMLAAFDTEGRLYVCDSAGVNARADELVRNPPDVIRVLEDTNEDGVFDRSWVYADKLVFPQGILWLNGSVYVSSPPNFLRLQDTDGDGVADVREVLASGFPNTGCADDMHGANLGRDGRVYWFCGRMEHDIRNREGTLVHKGTTPLMFRIRPDGTDMETVCGVLGNGVGVSFSQAGDSFVSGTFMADDWMGPGVRDGLIHTVYGGEYPVRGRVPNELRKTGPLLPPLEHLGAASVSDHLLYEGEAFGPGYHLFSCLFNMHRVMRHVLVPTGATYSCSSEDFVVSENFDFHPTDILEDADGSLLILDTGGWFRICCPSSQIAKPEVKGAIYRVRRQGARPPGDARGTRIRWNELTAAELTMLLDDSRPAVRSRAMEELPKLGQPAVAALIRHVIKGVTKRARQNAIWTLARFEPGAAADGVLAGLKDSEPEVQQVAAQVAGLNRIQSARSDLMKRVMRSALPVRREAAAALGRLGNDEAVPTLLSALSDANDRFLEHALIYALIEIGDPTGTRQGLDHPESAVRRGALIALDQMDGGNLEATAVMPHLGSDDVVLRETAMWITSHRPEWGREVSEYLTETMSGSEWSASFLAQLQGQFLAFAKEESVQELLGALAMDSAKPTPWRRMALEVMAQAPVKRVPSSWAEALRQAMTSPEHELVRQAVSTFQALPLDRRLVLVRTDLAINFPETEGAFGATTLNQDFAVRWTGSLKVTQPGLYRFYLTSDDGSRLRIGGQLIVDNDGAHAMKEASGELELKTGLHALELDYFQAGGGHGCVLSWERDGLREVVDALVHQGADGAWLPGLRGQYVSLGAAKSRLPDLTVRSFQADLFRVVNDPRRPEDLRIAALGALPEGLEQVDSALFDFLLDRLTPKSAPLFRVTVADVLGKARLSGPQLDHLVEVVPHVGALELPKLLPAFEGIDNEALGQALLSALGQSKGVSNLKREELRSVFAGSSESVLAELNTLTDRLEVDQGAQKQRLTELASGLSRGDVLRGSAVFNSPQAACSTCHRVGYVGGEVGPGLQRIGSIRSELDLLEAVVYPSLSFARGYETLRVWTQDGEEYDGVVREQNSDQIELITGANTRMRIARTDIKEMQPGTVSVMPLGLDGILSPQELADLVAFLKTL